MPDAALPDDVVLPTLGAASARGVLVATLSASANEVSYRASPRPNPGASLFPPGIIERVDRIKHMHILLFREDPLNELPSSAEGALC